MERTPDGFVDNRWPGAELVDLGPLERLGLTMVQNLGERLRPARDGVAKQTVALEQLRDHETIVTTINGRPASIRWNELTIDGRAIPLRLDPKAKFGPGTTLRLALPGAARQTLNARLGLDVIVTDVFAAPPDPTLPQSDLLQRVRAAQSLLQNGKDVNRPVIIDRSGPSARVGAFTDALDHKVPLAGAAAVIWLESGQVLEVSEQGTVPAMPFGGGQCFVHHDVVTGRPLGLRQPNGAVGELSSVKAIAAGVVAHEASRAELVTDGVGLPVTLDAGRSLSL